MGGIAGMIRFDGQEINPIETNKMASLLAHRGRLTRQPVEGGLLMRFGGQPEVMVGAQISAVADADVFSSTFADAPFSNNFALKGAGAFNEPNADFAVALWDSGNHTLYCARDIIGVKPFYYVHQPGRFFAFASEIKALNVLDEVTVKPNHRKLQEYLTWQTTNLPYNVETFHEDVYSVLPGHYLKVSSEKIAEIPYWEPDFKRFHQLGGIESYAACFRDVFTEAVAGRIKNRRNVGSHLSGGLDSSSVSCIAQSELMRQNRNSLNTFNIDTGLPLAEEQHFVNDVVDQWDTRHYRVSPLDDVLESVLKINTIFDRPEQFVMPSSFHLSITNELERLGCDVILTGHGGDNVATHGLDYLGELLNAGELDKFRIASEQCYHHYSTQPLAQRQNSSAGYERYLLSLLTQDIRSRYHKQSLTSLLSGMWKYKRILGISESAVASYIFEKMGKKKVHLPAINSPLSEDFKRQILPRTTRSTQESLNAVRSKHGVHFEGVLNNSNVMCNEQSNHIGAYHGHQYAFPFYDKNVIELCLATPLEVRFDQGRGRGLIRHGMQGILPPSVQTRSTKANFVEYGLLAAQQLYNAAWPHISPLSHPIWEVVDRKVFEGMVSVLFNPSIEGKLKSRYLWQVSRIIYLSIWLDSFGKRRA